ncbi:predicted protein [Naegleria gruberi]|uniref:non-specific serine/threonine protein kinase n=1 Tax=Naegleria gruberi TaxID=5762 RepID=D2V4R8_NAEGR|nr:uncharacterized protein NAEGRDRAFT_31119 [Naegleria gruberi]EFC48149.1 predicted protein [Naegleria gruberi]|eukprot:XP_002680893.1 predicted protein [Naegleria gruberi strain NEG-M]
MSFAPLHNNSAGSNTSTSSDPISQRYKNMSKIGQGGFGSVFRATDSRNNHEKALKVMKFTSFEDLNSIMKEGAQLMNINHPYILKVNEFFVDNDQLLCIDMDYYEKGDLTNLIKCEGYCSEIIVRKILDQSCQALDYIHSSMSLIHRDIKPNNIFIKSIDENDVHIIVADFGLARQNQGSVNVSYCGTPLFMSPEMSVGGKYNSTTDIYSLGVTIYQIMSKDTDTSISQLYMMKETETVKEFLKEKLTNAGKYSQDLIDLTISMLAKDYQSRPSAKAILDHLEKQTPHNQ